MNEIKINILNTIVADSNRHIASCPSLSSYDIVKEPLSVSRPGIVLEKGHGPSEIGHFLEILRRCLDL